MPPTICVRKTADSCSAPYETGAPCCYVDGPSADSEYELFQEDLDRLMPYIDAAIRRVPAFGEVGIKKVYNGAIAYTPDGSPIVGPAWDLKNFWLNEGHSFGVTAAGGAGWQLAEWITTGEPSVDMMGVDPRRFGPYAGRGYLRRKTEEAYAKVFTIHYPDEERGAARALKRAPCYDRMAAKGAVFGTVYGWERPGWFAPENYGLTDADLDPQDVILNENHAAADPGELPRERWSFRRSNYFEHVGRECRHVHEKVGLLDMSAFAKFEVSGPGAETWLESIFANRMPKKRGGISLCHMLTANGGTRLEATIQREAAQKFYLVCAGALERHDYDTLEKSLPPTGVRLQKITTQHGVFAIAGPRARDLLQPLTDTDLSTKAFPWLTGKFLSIGAAPVRALRVNFVGELGWELHHPIEMQNYLFDLLFEAGRSLDLKPIRYQGDGLPAPRKILPPSSAAKCPLNMPPWNPASTASSAPIKAILSAATPSLPGSAAVSLTASSPSRCTALPMPTPAAPSRSTTTTTLSAARPQAVMAGALANPWPSVLSARSAANSARNSKSKSLARSTRRP